MRHASLFSGIGGFDLAAAWMGCENVFQVEIDPFCQKVLQKNFPNVARYGDIKQFDGTKYRGTIDILTGGFPCQPYSGAGKRLGKEDERHLWPQMLRIIGEIQPSYIVGENVYGLVNWSGGMVFEEVQTDLENKGYEVAPVILPACAKNAPHRRDRIWFVAANTSRNGRQWNKEHTQGFKHNGGGAAFCKPHPYVSSWATANTFSKRFSEERKGSDRFTQRVNRIGCERIITNTNTAGIQRRPTSGHFEGQGEVSEQLTGGYYKRNDWGEFPTQSPICGRNDGIPNRVDRIKSLGNAIVPQVAFEIFKAISLTIPERR